MDDSHALLQQETKSQQVVETATKTGRKAVAEKEEQPEPKKGEIANEVLADPVAEKLCRQRCDNRKNAIQR